MDEKKTEDEEFISGRPNKSEIKRQMSEYFAISESLLNFSREALESTELSEFLIDTIIETNKMALTGSRKRQIKFIAKNLRDYSTEELKEITETLRENKKPKIKVTDEDQNWLGKLLSGDNESQNEFVDHFQNIDRQQLRTLVRNTRKNENTDKKNHFEKELVLYIKAQVVKE